jgi:nitrite reductase (NO-forming)
VDSTQEGKKVSSELDERALEQLRDELHHVEDELHQIEGEAHSARSASWITLPLAGMAMVIGIAALIMAAVFVRDNGNSTTTVVSKRAPVATAAPEAAKTVKFEAYKTPDPTLPAVPAGAVKKFRVDVFQHVTKVAADKPATQVWSFAVNGTAYRGTGASTPIVVNQGDKVQLTLVNGGSKAMGVTMPHSIDTHAAEVNPGTAFKSIAPGEKWTFSFVAKHPGVYMYHCATQPILMHTGSGMVGMLVVKPKGLTPAKELWMTQQEYYLGGVAGGPASMAKMQAKTPDVIAFNGYASQYKDHPIVVKRGERVRMYVMNAGPSIWTGVHVIGTVFDKTNVEGVIGHDSQTINLAPSQGGYVEFTLDKEGSYPFLTHAFGDMVKGAIGVLSTTNAPKAAAEGHSMGGAAPAKVAPVAGGVKTELGEMFIKPSMTQLKAGKVTFIAHNSGTLPHMLMVEKTPIKMDGPGQPTESAALGDTGIIQPGQTKSITVSLKKGAYELFCNVPGHYAAGQKTSVTVD